MIAVDQFIQIICRFGMIFVNMRNLRIGLPVDPIVQQINNDDTQCNRKAHHHNANAGFHRFDNQIKADNAQHDTACKAQQQTDYTCRVFLQHCANQTAQSGSANTCNGSCQNQSLQYTHTESPRFFKWFFHHLNIFSLDFKSYHKRKQRTTGYDKILQFMMVFVRIK